MDKYYNTLGIKPTNNLEDIELVYRPRAVIPEYFPEISF